ncbi:MAG: hypothetical protein QXZ43_03880 [Candidatus Aenigmatarchaeota archaeon]
MASNYRSKKIKNCLPDLESSYEKLKLLENILSFLKYTPNIQNSSNWKIETANINGNPQNYPYCIATYVGHLTDEIELLRIGSVGQDYSNMLIVYKDIINKEDLIEYLERKIGKPKETKAETGETVL